MKIEPHFKSLPTSSNHNCFGCSSGNSSGLQMTFFTDESSVFSRVKIPPHLCGWNNVAHGGIISTILDETMSWAAMYLLKRVSLTQTLTVEFKKPVFVSTLMESESSILDVKGRRDVIVQGILSDGDGKACATSQGTFKTFSPEVARRLGIADDPMLDWYHSLFEKQE